MPLGGRDLTLSAMRSYVRPELQGDSGDGRIAGLQACPEARWGRIGQFGIGLPETEKCHDFLQLDAPPTLTD